MRPRRNSTDMRTSRQLLKSIEWLLECFAEMFERSGVHVEQNPFVQLREVNSFGRTERLEISANPTEELARVQVEDTRSWVVTVQVKEATPGTQVTATIESGGGNCDAISTYDVGDRIDVTVFGNTVKLTVTISNPSNLSPVEALVTGGISEGAGSTLLPSSWVPAPENDGVVGQASGTIAVGPARLALVSGYRITNSSTAAWLMFFDVPNGTALVNGMAPKWAITVPAFGTDFIKYLQVMPLSFGQGIAWATSTTPGTLTITGVTIRLDAQLADAENVVEVAGNIPQPGGPGNSINYNS